MFIEVTWEWSNTIHISCNKLRVRTVLIRPETNPKSNRKQRRPHNKTLLLKSKPKNNVINVPIINKRLHKRNSGNKRTIAAAWDKLKHKHRWKLKLKWKWKYKCQLIQIKYHRCNQAEIKYIAAMWKEILLIRNNKLFINAIWKEPSVIFLMATIRRQRLILGSFLVRYLSVLSVAWEC